MFYFSGWFNTMGEFKNNVGVAILMLLVAIGFTFCGVSMLLLLFRVRMRVCIVPKDRPNVAFPFRCIGCIEALVPAWLVRNKNSRKEL